MNRSVSDFGELSRAVAPLTAAPAIAPPGRFVITEADRRDLFVPALAMRFHVGPILLGRVERLF